VRTLHTAFFASLFILLLLCVEGCTVVLVNSKIDKVEARIETRVYKEEEGVEDAPQGVR